MTPRPLSATQLAVLAAICDTLSPAVPPSVSPPPSASPSASAPASTPASAAALFRSSSLGANAEFMQVLHEGILSLDSQKVLEMKLLLTALSTTAGSLLLFNGGLRPFHSRDLATRTRNIRSLMSSSIGVKRKVFVGLKRLILGLAYSYVSPEGENAHWRAIGYEGPPPVLQSDKAHVDDISDAFDGAFLNETLPSSIPKNLEFDYVIIGSGAGGGVAAETFASKGHSVLVLEKGDHVKQRDMTQVESESFNNLYEKKGLLTTSDGNLIVLAGAGLGGGTTINWACCLDTPYYVRDEWVTKHGLIQFHRSEFPDKNTDFDLALESVKQRIGVSDKGVVHNRMNSILMDGCEKLGLPCKVAPQNFQVSHPEACESWRLTFQSG